MRSTLKFLSLATAAALLVVSSGTAFGDNLASNGGFEVAGTDGPADSAQWVEFTNTGTASMSVRDDSMPESGDFAHLLMAVGADNIGAVAGINQNSIIDGGLLSLQENTTLNGSFSYKGELGPGGVAFAALRILNGDGAIVADTGLQSLAPTSSYQTFDFASLTVPAFGGGPNDTYAAFFEVTANAGAFDGAFSTIYVDNVNISGATVIPEPTTAMFFGLAAFGMFGRRRR